MHKKDITQATTMLNYSNAAEFKMHNNAERYFWAGYHLFVFLSSFLGDSLILYASSQKGAFKLNEFIVTIIQHIAVSDLAFAVSSVLPKAVSLIADSWILGEELCYSRAYLGHFTYTSGMFLIAFLTTSKLMILKYPLRCQNLTPKKAHGLCVLITALTLPMPIVYLILDWEDVDFDYRTYSCEYKCSTKVLQELIIVSTAISQFLPNIIIIITTVPTLMYIAAARKSAERVRGSLPWQGAMTVTMTATVSCLSNLPFFLSYLLAAWSSNSGQNATDSFRRIAGFLLIINIMSNFYIYTLTIKSFRKFLYKKFCFLGTADLHLHRLRTWNTASVTGKTL